MKQRTRKPRIVRVNGAVALLGIALTLAACGSSGSTTSDSASATTAVAGSTLPSSAIRTFRAEVWADNWFALYLGDVKIGEDSVPITTERSFNSETFTFDGAYPLQLRAVSKDYIQDDTGLEYIGTDRQQVGDGGFILQITDLSTAQVVAATDASWKGFVVHAAPLNDCADSKTPEQTCVHRITVEPPSWKATTFNDSSWPNATVYTETQVGVKGGYTTISWAPTAKLIWTADLKVDNTILWRRTVAAPDTVANGQ